MFTSWSWHRSHNTLLVFNLLTTCFEVSVPWFVFANLEGWLTSTDFALLIKTHSFFLFLKMNNWSSLRIPFQTVSHCWQQQQLCFQSLAMPLSVTVLGGVIKILLSNFIFISEQILPQTSIFYIKCLIYNKHKNLPIYNQSTSVPWLGNNNCVFWVCRVHLDIKDILASKLDYWECTRLWADPGIDISWIRAKSH